MRPRRYWIITRVFSLRLQRQSFNLRAWISGSPESCNPDPTPGDTGPGGRRVDRTVHILRMFSETSLFRLEFWRGDDYIAPLSDKGSRVSTLTNPQELIRSRR
jgi:hypothetical protein